MILSTNRIKVIKSLRSQLAAQVILAFLIIMGIAYAYGSSTEDLVGIFSMEKTIKLGSSSDCFGAAGGEKDPLSPVVSRSASSMADDQPPSLAGFSFRPEAIPATRPCAINFTEHVIDDQSGFFASAARFSSPSGSEKAQVLFTSANLSSGNSRDGIYTASLHLPDGIEKGLWQLENLTLVDKEGNRRIMQREDVLDLGLLTEFRIV
jgi:hypothetical protein